MGSDAQHQALEVVVFIVVGIVLSETLPLMGAITAATILAIVYTLVKVIAEYWYSRKSSS